MGRVIPLVLRELLANVNELARQELLYKWVQGQPTTEELAAAEKEATGGDAFDRLGLKRSNWAALKAGRAKLVCRSLQNAKTSIPLARVICILPTGQREPPWSLWARIFLWFGQAASGKPWRVTWFAAAAPRRFPYAGQDLGPEHVNGGYTRPCSTDGIFIYRAEEATRVLVHELVHAACLDEHPHTEGVHIARSKGARDEPADKGWSIPLREAQVEVWAELLLIAILSRGKRGEAERLWALQSQWVANTNRKARMDHGTHDASDYAWRYLCGREVMYARLGVALPAADAAVAATLRSVRFTHPALGP